MAKIIYYITPAVNFSADFLEEKMQEFNYVKNAYEGHEFDAPIGRTEIILNEDGTAGAVKLTPTDENFTYEPGQLQRGISGSEWEEIVNGVRNFVY